MNDLNRAGVTQLVECDLAKVDVAGSNPVSRSSLAPSVSYHNLEWFYHANSTFDIYARGQWSLGSI